MKITTLTHCKIYTGENVINNGFIRFSNKILEIGNMCDYQPISIEKIVNVNGKIVIPGFIDVHSHGGYSFDAMDGSAEQISEMVNKMSIHEGITSYFASTMTQSEENISKAMAQIEKAAKNNPIIKGIHLEGPFISEEFKGAQDKKYIQNPNVELLDKWNSLSGGLVKIITFAPEKQGARQLEDYCLEHGIVASAGHTNATRSEMQLSKVTHITHLYNAQREFKHREPGVTGHALLEDNIYTEMIADGFHVCPDMINLAYKLKGANKLELVTDSMRAKGMPEGISELGGQKVIVKDKQARLESGNLAGSVLPYIDAFKNIIKFTGCSISDAVKMSSVNQAREFNLTEKGKLQVGYDADINILDNNLNLVDTYSYGHSVRN